MWFVSLDVTNSTMNITFSEMLAENQTVQIMFIVFYIFYFLENTVLIYMLESDEFDFENENRNKKRFAYDIITAFTCFFILLQLAFLLLVFVAPINVTAFGTVHYIVASITFGSGILVSFLLLIRRAMIKLLINNNLEYKNLHITLFIMNLIEFIGQVTMALLIIFIRSGVYEFVLTLLIILDRFLCNIDWSIYKKPDFAFKAKLMMRMNISTNTKQLSKGKNFIYQ